jgi:hypothetical protein
MDDDGSFRPTIHTSGWPILGLAVLVDNFVKKFRVVFVF